MVSKYGSEKVVPHDFKRRGWRFYICTYCFAPRSLHPRTKAVWQRPPWDNDFLGRDAPHFKEGW